MKKNDGLERLITATITGVIQDGETLHITARSLSGTIRNYVISVEGGELAVSVLEGLGDEEEE